MAVASPDPYFPPEKPRRTPLLFTALVVTTVGVLVAGLVSVAALASSSSNAPEDAVRSLTQATGSGNLTAALAAIDPGESSGIGPALTAVVSDLQKIGVLDSSLSLSDVGGLSVTFDKLTTTTTYDPSRSDIAAVTLTGGTVTTHFDPAQLALGSLAKNLLSGRLSKLDHSSPVAETGRPAPQLVTVLRNGQWYVSIGYTLAQAALTRAGVPFPAAVSAIAPAGAGSAEDAARQFLAAAAQRDGRGAIALLDPTNTAALHDYGSSLLAHVPTGTTTPATITGLILTPSSVEGGTMETVTSFTATSGSNSVTLAGGCLQITSPSAPQQVCPPAGSNAAAGLGLVAVQRGSGWYIDPYRSVLDDLDRALSGADLGTLLGQLSTGGAGPLGMLGILGCRGGITPTGPACASAALP